MLALPVQRGPGKDGASMHSQRQAHLHEVHVKLDAAVIIFGCMMMPDLAIHISLTNAAGRVL